MTTALEHTIITTFCQCGGRQHQILGSVVPNVRVWIEHSVERIGFCKRSGSSIILRIHQTHYVTINVAMRRAIEMGVLSGAGTIGCVIASEMHFVANICQSYGGGISRPSNTIGTILNRRKISRRNRVRHLHTGNFRFERQRRINLSVQVCGAKHRRKQNK